ncbi:hypothetical protein R4P64_07685 [Rhodococcus sp. IEGM 1366]|uniref:hypothetical protein n=1 Tax=Rhodococcus sp. IEGM 1366 TaxID=3082223 RepID=UPI00295551E0|nr:hypothetical protein [Rhodococcus sp. IEGM 1366]MDV8066382.1 hypothetical protein [Rhodococcus sp. IEGM 1366]
MGIAPDNPYPDGAYGKRGTMRGFQDIDEAEAKRRMRKPVDDSNNTAWNRLFGGLFAGFSGFGMLLDNIATAIFGGGPFDPASAMGRIQTRGIVINTLQSTTQKLEGIIGYGSWVPSQNKYIGLISSADGRVMQFDTQQGPKVGVELYTDPLLANNKIIRLKSEGLWEIKAQTKARETNFTGLDKIRLDIVVRAPDGSEYYRRSADGLAHKNEGLTLNPVGDGEGCVKGDLFVVVPEPDYTVHIEMFTGRWRWFYGGSQWAGLSVLKHSSEVEHTGVVNPGDPPIAS